MSDQLLIDLADASRPEEIVAVILRHHADWQPPVPVDVLSSTVGIKEIADLTTEGFVGALMTNDAKTDGVILVKKGERPTRRRFTIGHELGHFLIRSHRGNKQCTAADLREMRRDTEHQRQEWEANRFAAGLLMPRSWFQRDMDRLGSPDLSHMQQLAERYETSFEATANRYLELTDESCSVVFSKNGIIRYARSSKTFPSLSVGKGDRLPIGSRTHRLNDLPLREPSDWDEVDVVVWINTERGRHAPSVLEQTMHQQDGYRVTMIYLELTEHDEDEDEFHIEERWTPRFPR